MIGRSSFAFGKVVLICSCSMSEPAMFAEQRFAVLMCTIQAAVSTCVTHVLLQYVPSTGVFALSGWRCVSPTLLGASVPGSKARCVVTHLTHNLKRRLRTFFARSSILSGGQSSTSMPRCKPIPDSTSLISFKDLRPKFGVRSISASVFWIRSPM